MEGFHKAGFVFILVIRAPFPQRQNHCGMGIFLSQGVKDIPRVFRARKRGAFAFIHNEPAHLTQIRRYDSSVHRRGIDGDTQTALCAFLQQCRQTRNFILQKQNIARRKVRKRFANLCRFDPLIRAAK